jgi:Uma2 family endonuclease
MASHSISLVDLHNGDRMSRDEFLWRWEQIPDIKRAELIDGVVYLSSPLSEWHSDYELLLCSWLLAFEDRVPGLKILPNATWLLGDSSPQPDLALIRQQGSSHSEGKFRQGPPELAVEISYSSLAYDLGPKLELYRRTGVQEYLTILLEDKKAQWRVLGSDGRYRLLKLSGGFLKSKIFPGLWLDPVALFPPDRKRLLAGVEAGSKSIPAAQPGKRRSP